MFEQDPVKYVQYEEAVLARLRDKIKERGGKAKTKAEAFGRSKSPTPPPKPSNTRLLNGWIRTITNP